jgi:hypothetical protein
MDFTGEVVEVGPGVTDSVPGQRVWGYLGGLSGLRRTGAAADYLVVQRDRVAAAPTTVDLVTAAALPTVGLTALQALRDALHLRTDQRLLVIGASGGVGSAAIQLAKAMGANVTAVASARNAEFCHQLGADKSSTTPPHCRRNASSTHSWPATEPPCADTTDCCAPMAGPPLCPPTRSPSPCAPSCNLAPGPLRLHMATTARSGRAGRIRGPRRTTADHRTDLPTGSRPRRTPRSRVRPRPRQTGDRPQPVRARLNTGVNSLRCGRVGETWS